MQYKYFFFIYIRYYELCRVFFLNIYNFLYFQYTSIIIREFNLLDVEQAMLDVE